jgi:EAL domain-containing protein (putative c-di-GMP-specific phosphodiesterase class I)
MAFQPIVDSASGKVHAYEALVRGADGRGAAELLATLDDDNRYAFDQQCRVAAIEQAVQAGILNGDARLSINFMPNAVYSPVACIQLTLQTAAACGFPTERLNFEFTENEEMDVAHTTNIVETYRRMGFTTALDDFGAGHAGLGLLARFTPDFLKLDRQLVSDVDTSLSRRMIVESVLRLAQDLGIGVIAEGVETSGEFATLRNLGIRYMQGYWLARPALGALPPIRDLSKMIAAAA